VPCPAGEVPEPWTDSGKLPGRHYLTPAGMKNGDIPRRVHFGPVSYVFTRVNQIMQGVGVPDAGSGDLDVLSALGRLRRHETSARSTVIRERKLAILRDDFHDQVRAAVAPASLEGVGGGEQMPVTTAQVHLDVDIAIRLPVHAIDPAGDGDAPILHNQPVGQIDPVERIARTAMPRPELVQPLVGADRPREQVPAATQRERQHDRSKNSPWAPDRTAGASYCQRHIPQDS
jgi:hypothetical protein